MKRTRRKLDASLYILLGLVIVALLVAFLRDARLPLAGIEASGRLLRGVWVEIALGFVLAGLLEVLLPAQAMAQWLGRENLGRGILVGWAAGLILPGGPYMLFPIAANLIRTGAEPGPVIALLTAKTLVSPIRMFTYEATATGVAADAGALHSGSTAAAGIGVSWPMALQHLQTLTHLPRSANQETT